MVPVRDYGRRVEGLIEHSESEMLEEIEPPTGKVPIATLAHGLDRVLFNPGVHWVQDPRSRVYNFNPFVQNVPDIKDFGFERLPPFIRSSRDTIMRGLAESKGKRFAGSTSSLTGLLCHIYFLLSQDHTVDVRTMAAPFSTARTTFTPGQRMPTAVVFNHKNGVYMIDSDSTDNDDSEWNILMWLGTMLESFLTLPRNEFEKLLRTLSPENTFEKQPEAYRYSQSKSFVMRSQLDCVDPRLPGSGVFDIKTRAALPLRMDNLNFKENSGYLITSLHGYLHSFDREYYDLIRSAFLKYSFQARIGNMDGIFLAYHNTARIFGFQYVPLEEMDRRLFGDYLEKKPNGISLGQYETGGTAAGWRIFKKCVRLLEEIASEIAECFPGKSVTCLAETRKNRGVMRIWVQPVDEETEPTNDDEIPMVTPSLKKPIVLLEVTTHNFLDGQPVLGPGAVFGSKKPWTVQWSISRSTLSERIIRKELVEAKHRKNRPTSYPAGVDAENLEEFIKNLGFGNPETMPNAKNFKRPDAFIRRCRMIARAGALEAERLKLEDEARGVQVLGQEDALYPEGQLSSASNKSNGDKISFASL
ncbi:Pet127-domain-containing protein [Fomitiporia mediterranea MF3/22]|uniref:Pet127-domain-containing protein n=1 Tax=Fomitiporia mediterranea (strain MF3/22) TaxID=694068 RepID=UPI0004407577|nr:Pet127-domain-containing protein [Fomitiporia mediterranea MF3/22]EJC98163.1 Pet127-domain-containing protein [Fomitiporia mediterranea MF3/22]